MITAPIFSLIVMIIIIPPNFHKPNIMIDPRSLKIPWKNPFRNPAVFPRHLPVTVLFLIALVCITIPVGATDAQNSTACSASVPVDDLTVDEPTGHHTPAVSVTYELTATPTIESLASLDDPAATVQVQTPGIESAERPMISPVVTSAPLVTGTLPAEDPIRAISTVASPGISETEPEFHPLGAAPVALFVGTPTLGTAPLPVKFLDASIGNPTTWAWYFGDETYNQPWTLQTNQVPWSERTGQSGVAMPDGSIVVMGGWNVDLSFPNDVWISKDSGRTWTRQIASAPWSGRSDFTSVVISDGSLVLMGGANPNTLSDVWISMDSGRTWTRQTAAAAWGGRYFHTSVVMPDGSILLMGGSNSNYDGLNDIWKSTDRGATWTRQTDHASWRGCWSPISVLMPDGSLMLMGGLPDNGHGLNDVWRLPPVGSTEQNPTHTYTVAGTYPVTLRVSNANGYTTGIKNNYITVDSANIVIFGNTSKITTPPSHSAYSRLGGMSAIRRDGSTDTFTGDIALKGTDWIQVTNGAAIKKDGNLVRWSSTLSMAGTPLQTSTVAETGKKYVFISQYSDWLLAIYEDMDGQTHLEPIANPASPPEIFKNMPTGTGWKQIAAGNNHALALRSDGTLVSWGKNDYGQLNLPADKIYSDIEAGEDLSIGLTNDSHVYAAGSDVSGAVSGINRLPSGDYIAVAAGSNMAAVLSRPVKPSPIPRHPRIPGLPILCLDRIPGSRFGNLHRNTM